MKKVWCLLAFFLVVISCPAQQKENVMKMQQFSDIKVLKSFYYQYIMHELNWDQYYESYKSGLEWKLRSQQMMREKLFVPELIAEMNEWEFLSADHVIHAHEAVEYMLKSLDVKPLGSPEWYRVSWSCGDEEETILDVKLCKMKERDDLSSYILYEKAEEFAKGTDKMMIRYDGSLYLTPSKRKAFAKESEALNKQAVQLGFHHMSNQDSIAKALELLDKAIALNHQNLYAYGNKINLLKGGHRYDEALRTLDEAICFHPENHGFYLMEGVILEKLGRMDEALPHYQRGLELCEARFKKNPLPGTFLDGYLLKYSVYRKDIPNTEIIEAIPASFQKADKEHIINLLNAAGSIQKIHAGFVK